MEARGLQSARGASAKSSDARCLSRGDRASSSKIDVFEMEQMAGELDGRLEKTESRSDLMEAMQVRQAMLERQDSQGKIKEEGSLPDHVLSAASQCSEFFKAPAVDLLESLRAKYDPTGKGAKLQPQLHSDQALLQRESLKFDPLILKTLEELWQVIDTNKNGVLDQDEYHEFHSKLALVLVPTASIRQSQIFFEQDWNRDTDGGRLRVTKKVFGESMFELADRWTDSISAVDYIRFLHGTFQALSELDPTGRRVYRSDASIREHMRTLAPLSSLHAKTLSAARDKAAAFERARARALREGRELTWEDFEALYVAHKDKYANPKQGGPAGAQLYAKRALARSSTGLAEERIRKALESAARRGSARTNSRQSLRRSASSSGSFKGTRTRHGSQVAAGGGSDEDEDEKRRRASRALEGNRFYPPPASWWARHARRKHSADAAARASALTGNTRLAFSPEGQDFVGILLFDARDPRRLYHLIISTQRMSVEDSAVLEIRHALRRAELDGHERLLVSSPCEDRLCAEARSAGFSHAVSQADWVNFCTRVDELTTGSTKLWMDRFEFAGFASAYNKQAGGVCCNFLFDAEEMSAKLNYVTVRPQLGLGCPYLQAQVAKFVAHKLRVEFGNGAPAPTANTSGCPSMLRSTSSRLLLETLDKGYVPDGDDQRLQSQERQRSAQGGLGGPSIVAASQSDVDTLSSSSPGARTLQRTESSLDGFSATSEVQQEAARFGLHKRHTLGALNEKERKVRQEVLSQRQRHRIAAVEHRYRRKNEVPSLQTFLESQYGVRYPGIVRSSSKLPPRNSLPALPPRNVRSSAKPSA